MNCKHCLMVPLQISRMKKTLMLLRQYSSSATNNMRPLVVPTDIWAKNKDQKYTGTEVVEGKWHYVERLFPQLRIPTPPKQASSTGWKQPSAAAPDLPYFVGRSRNHMLPVYLSRVYADRVLVTQVRRIKGDIWEFEQHLKKYLEQKLSQKIESHVNEMACFVNVKGDHVATVTDWLYEKGF